MYWVQEMKLDLEQRIALKISRNQKDKLWEASSSYVGDWKNGLRDGFGVQIWPNGSKYEGPMLSEEDFANPIRNVVLGDWRKDRRHGNGIYYVQNPDGKLNRVYSGGWAHNLKHGMGTYFYKNGCVWQKIDLHA